jgi:hypothetical protein
MLTRLARRGRRALYGPGFVRRALGRKNPLSALTLAWEASWLASAVSLPAVVMETSFRGLVTAAGTTLACPWPRAAGVRL